MSQKNRARFRLEALESRDAPATLVSATKLTYQDIDGDNVAITLSKPLLNAGNVNSVFLFDTGTVDGFNSKKQQLQKIDLTGFGAAATGTSITAVATHSALTGGDGFAALGQIDARGIDLGAVTIDGDLGRILAGDATTATSGLKGLTVQSLGRFGTSTGAVDLHTLIQGKLDFLRVKTDVKEAFVQVAGGADGRMGPVFVGGSVAGGTSDSSGRISSSGAMAFVTILGNLTGGGGANSGLVATGSTLAGMIVGGSVIGGAGGTSGQIFSLLDMGFVTISGNLIGGSGIGSGEMFINARLAGARVGGSVIGGPGNFSGRILSGGDMGFVTVAGNMIGGGGSRTGEVSTNAKLAGVKVGSSVVGGAGDNSGRIASGADMGSVTIAGNLIGGGGLESGDVFSKGKLASLFVGGSLIGGSGPSSGEIFSTLDMGPVTIGHDMIGGSAAASGSIVSQAKLARLTIGGSLLGGSGPNSGEVASSLELGPVRVARDIVGGSGNSTGLITSLFGRIGDVTIGGSLIGGTGVQTGEIAGLRGDLGAVRVGHDIVGASISGTATNGNGSGAIFAAGRILSVSVGGSIISGTDTSTNGKLLNNATIRAGDNIGALFVGGSLVGNSNANGDSPVIISARGQHTILPGATSDIAIGRIAIGGRVEFAEILAGYDTGLLPKNADAQIGVVIIAGDWIASTIVAGVVDGGNGFGNSLDAKISGAGTTDRPEIVSKIASIFIGGLALGTPGSVSATDSFGMEAQQIGTLKIGGFSIPLAAGAANDLAGLPVGVTGDLEVLEVAL